MIVYIRWDRRSGGTQRRIEWSSAITVVALLQTLTRNYSFNTKRYLPFHSLRTGSHNVTITTVDFNNSYKYSEGLAWLYQWPCDHKVQPAVFMSWIFFKIHFVGGRELWATRPRLTGDDRIKYQAISDSTVLFWNIHSNMPLYRASQSIEGGETKKQGWIVCQFLLCCVKSV